MRFVNVIALVLVLAMNGLAQRLPLGGKTTGELSAQYPTMITPAGYAFSIWLLIYALLIGFVIYSFTPQGRKSDAVRAAGIYFPLSCLFNAGWLLAWHYEYVTASVFVMLALLLSLIAIYTRVRSTGAAFVSMADRWLVRLPFSIYLGWICVATIVNVSAALYDGGWDRFGLSDTFWTVLMLAVAATLALWIGMKRTDAAVILVFVWAFIAIAVKQQAFPTIVYVAAALAAALALAAGLAFARGVRAAA
jgi:hypothetical protein